MTEGTLADRKRLGARAADPKAGKKTGKKSNKGHAEEPEVDPSLPPKITRSFVVSGEFQHQELTVHDPKSTKSKKASPKAKKGGSESVVPPRTIKFVFPSATVFFESEVSAERIAVAVAERSPFRRFCAKA